MSCISYLFFSDTFLPELTAVRKRFELNIVKLFCKD